MLLRVVRRSLLAIAVLIGVSLASEAIAHFLDPATADERAVLREFTGQISPPDCEPIRTSAIADRPNPGGWVEVDAKERALLDAQYRAARPPARSVTSEPGLLFPAIMWLYGKGACTNPVAMSTPAIVGDRAFVTLKSRNGVNAVAFIRKSGRWLFESSTWDGEPLIEY